MCTYDIVCPRCKALNRQLYLEETDGWMECDRCKFTVRYRLVNGKMIPIRWIKKIELQKANR